MQLMKIYGIVLGVMNLLTFIAFAVDKFKSKNEENSRMPEVALLSLMSFGGAVGGLIGMYVLRHKTNFKTKFHFGVTVWLSLLVQAAIAALILYFGA